MEKTKEAATAFLGDLIRRMNQQNNRATATPYFYVVQTERWQPVHDEFHNGETRTCWVDYEGDPTIFYSKEEFLKWAQDYYEGTKTEAEIETQWDNLQQVTEGKYYEEDNVFFTQDAYDEHVRLNGHNLRRNPYCSYVKHAFRNPELAEMFRAIGVLVGEPWKER